MASTRGRGGIRTKSNSWGSKSRSGGAGVASGYKSIANNFKNKISSYKTLCTQTQGAANSKWGRPSPTTLNSFANWINKGAILHTVTRAQVARWAKSKNKNWNSATGSPTSCKSILCAKFGKNAIKAVCCTKTGSFMVATSPTVAGRAFNFPK